MIEMDSKTGKAFAEVEQELITATLSFAPMHSPHEGWATLREEVDELWEEVKRSKPPGHSRHEPASVERMRHEAKQVAAMAIRFMIDICGVHNVR